MAAVPSIGLVAGAAAGLLAPGLPLAVLFVLLAAGAAIAAAGWRAGEPRLLLTGVAAAFAAGGALLAADAWRAASQPTLGVAFDALAGAGRDDRPVARNRPSDRDAAFAVVTGVLRADAALRPAGGVSLSLDVRSVRAVDGWADDTGLPLIRRSDGSEVEVQGGVLLTVGGTLAASRIDEWRAGRIVRAPAELRRPTRYLNPGARDEARALARRGVTLVGAVKSGALVEVVARGGVLPEAAAAARAAARRAIDAAVGRWSRRSAAIVAAILIGDRAGLGEDLERRLQEAGIYHVIAISGGNIAVLAVLLLLAFRIAGALGPSAMATAASGLLAYGYLVAGGASVERATLMAAVCFAGRAIDLRGPPVNAVAVVAAVLVAFRPLLVADPAFILTFGATLAIVVAVPAVPAVVASGAGEPADDVQARRLPRMAAPAAALAAASLAAEAALMPVGAFLFSRVALAGLALNFAAIPLMTVVQVAGLAAIAAAAVSPVLAAGCGWIAHAAAEGLVRSADLVQFAPALAWRVAPPHWMAIACYYAGLVVAWTLWRQAMSGGETARRRRARRVASGVAGVAAFWILAQPWTMMAARGGGRLSVTFIDVGQGDAALVRFPRGETMLVDAGGLPTAFTGTSFDLGDRVVAPVLRRAGIRRLGSIVLTHGDADHAGGAAAMLREFRPRDVWEGIPVPRFEPLGALQALAASHGARWVRVQTEDRVVIDGVEVVVRHPRPADWERQEVRNDDSIVLELLWGDVSIVLTGDIGRDAEGAMAGAFSPSPLRVVKVPHHGSLTSSTAAFVHALSPRVAVVSAGRGNRFGHPAPEVLERYRRAGAEVFRTDRDGAVTVVTDGRSLEVATFMGRRVRLPR